MGDIQNLIDELSSINYDISQLNIFLSYAVADMMLAQRLLVQFGVRIAHVKVNHFIPIFLLIIK